MENPGRRRAAVFWVAIMLLFLSLPSPRASANTAPPGVIVPLYSSSPSAWSPVTNAKAAHPNVPIAGVINPADGPGSTPSSDYATLVGQLRAAGIVVLGYSYTSYGSRNASAVEAEINEYVKWYNVNGIFLDQMASKTGEEAYYSSLTAYAKSLGLTMVVGNPGVDVAPSYVGTVDTIVLYENSGFPFPPTLGGWHTSYPKSSWAVMAYNVGSLSQACVVSASNYVGYVDVTDGAYPTQWGSLPPYFGDLVATLDSQPPQECLETTSAWPNGTPITGLWATVQAGGTFVSTGFTPMLYAAAPGTAYTVNVPDYRTYLFAYWADTGSQTNARTISLTSDTIITAVFTNSSGPPPPGESEISVNTVDSSGGSLIGMYTAFWSSASVLPGCSSPCSSQGLIKSCFSPCSAFVGNSASYYVSVADYGTEAFSHWSDGTTTRFYTVVVGGASAMVGLTAVYSP